MNKMLKKILVIASSIIIIMAIIYFKYFMNDEIKTNNDIKFNNYVITNHIGNIDTYDESLYIEGYKGNYDYAYYITGKIKVDINSKFILITFDLLDKDNKVIGKAQAGLNDIEKNKEYEFKAISLEDEMTIQNVVGYKIKSIESK